MFPHRNQTELPLACDLIIQTDEKSRSLVVELGFKPPTKSTKPLVLMKYTAIPLNDEGRRYLEAVRITFELRRALKIVDGSIAKLFPAIPDREWLVDHREAEEALTFGLIDVLKQFTIAHTFLYTPKPDTFELSTSGEKLKKFVGRIDFDKVIKVCAERALKLIQISENGLVEETENYLAMLVQSPGGIEWYAQNMQVLQYQQNSDQVHPALEPIMTRLDKLES